MQELSGGSILRWEHDDSGGLSSGLVLSDRYSVRDAVPLSIGYVQHGYEVDVVERLHALHTRVVLRV
jgi:hypothetical protein